MTIDFLPGDRVKIADDSPYSDEFNGKFATVLPVNYGAVPDWVTVAPDGDPTHKGRLETKYLTYIPKEGDVVHVAAPSTYRGDNEVLSADNDEMVTVSRYPGGLQAKFNTQTVDLVRRATAQKEHPMTEQYPVGCTVRDKKYGIYGTVVDHRAPGGGPVVEVTGDDGKTYRAGFPSPEERLERVHILTHDELVLLDEAVPVSDRSYDKRANEILSAHLHPTVTRTFEVTVVQPADAPKPVGPSYIEHMLTTGDQTGLQVTIKEKTS